MRDLAASSLLAEDSVDQRMLEIVRAKAEQVDEYARRSDLKDITPDAMDISFVGQLHVDCERYDRVSCLPAA